MKVTLYRCDLCNDILSKVPDKFEARMQILDEIDVSFESEADKSTYEQGPKLILCDYCQNHYLIPNYVYS